MELNIQLLDQFKEYLVQEEKSKATIEKYMRDVYAFYESMEENKIINKERVVDYKNKLLESYKITSINSMLVAINKLLLFLNVPQYGVKVLKVQRQIFREESKDLTKEEYQRLVKAAKKNERLYLLVQALCSTGIRVSEHKFITVESLCTGKAIIHNKGKVREIIIHKKLVKLLKKYCKDNAIMSGPIFITRTGKALDRSNIWKMMKELCKEARVEKTKVFPHNLRHLFGFTYYELQKDIVRLADILGHSSTETTRIYTKTSHYGYDKIFIKMNLLDV